MSLRNDEVSVVFYVDLKRIQLELTPGTPNRPYQPTRREAHAGDSPPSCNTAVEGQVLQYIPGSDIFALQTRYPWLGHATEPPMTPRSRLVCNGPVGFRGSRG